MRTGSLLPLSLLFFGAARLLGLTILPSVLLRADEMIQ